MSENLSRMLIQRILANIGAVPDSPEAALRSSDLLLNTPMKIKYEGGPINHNMYAGQLSIGDSKLKGLLIDLTVDDYSEFLFLFRMSELSIHAVKTLYDQTDLGETYLKSYNSEKDSWNELSIEYKGRLMADFDKFTSYGFLWDDCDDYDDLFQAAIKLINLQKG